MCDVKMDHFSFKFKYRLIHSIVGSQYIFIRAHVSFEYLPIGALEPKAADGLARLSNVDWFTEEEFATRL